jgi:hypothetical protein
VLHRRSLQGPPSLIVVQRYILLLMDCPTRLRLPPSTDRRTHEIRRPRNQIHEKEGKVVIIEARDLQP